MKQKPIAINRDRPAEFGTGGFTLLETLIATLLLAFLFLSIAPFFAARYSASQRLVKDTLPPVIARGIADSIIVGSIENFDSVHNIFFFDYEGIRVEIDLPESFQTREYPGIVVRDTRDGIVSTPIDPQDISTVAIGGFALSHGIIVRPGRNRVLDAGTVPHGDDRIIALGLYPLGPIAQVEAKDNMRASGADYIETVTLPVEERDIDGDGIFSELENFNGSWVKRGGILVRSIDTYEDTGGDRLISQEEAGYHRFLNPDPAGDDFDPVLNPNGSEGNGRLDRLEDQNKDQYLNVPDRYLDEDINQDGVLNNSEVDLNGNELTSDRNMETPDRPTMSSSAKLGATRLANPSYPLPSDPVRSYGYTIIVRRPTDEQIYLFRILMYQNFFDVRPLLQQATPLRRQLVSRGEIGDLAANGIDDDHDGVIDDTPPYSLDWSNPNAPWTPSNPFADPEIAKNGIDDDHDGVIDDGLIQPIHVHTFVLRVGVGSAISLPGDPR